ncbi:phytanoyl-CoA dioxygenase family protein [Tsukamurella strandjordii]|uniref:Phytanoyl-CoA dioxygenase family protein n=1 Tax=Tsukamurella strandjordii TaxID=147577 RepID=A0AA90S8C2_9ACTN|nr:phytanoyl-CoA dioxygenase family protein [Tsukamurella strandjordii]MDP0398675.1 phytanoyl-CoA dioxygenase family protein [Tsukamurella strandjordii]
MATTASSRPVRVRAQDCDLDEFVALLSTETDLAAFPNATGSERGLLTYGDDVQRRAADDPAFREDLGDELVRALLDGPGIVVFPGAFDQRHGLDECTAAYTAMIREQRAAGGAGGDHFAAPGANDRIWNALQKLALRDPALFVRYYANDVLNLIAQAWLGPMYQVTSAINVVNPGGGAQSAHRDYHLGFMSPETAAQFRIPAHLLSPALTLQGAVAHVDMPLESGPTMYLPYSQRYPNGYLAFNLPEFQQYFAEHYVQLPLAAGDAVFFNPALFHAAGSNVSGGIRRMANLLQVSSAFGRAMESVDRSAMLRATYPHIANLAASDPRGAGHAVAATAEGYAFPSNLDLDQPVTGMHGETQAELTHRALDAGMSAAEFSAQLSALDARRLA